MGKVIVTPVLADVIALGAVAVAPIAAQAGTGPTSTTFKVNGGSLNISTRTAPTWAPRPSARPT